MALANVPALDSELIIDRSQWYRGHGGDDSRLRRASDAKMCCLGFYCMSQGAAANDIEGLAFPSHLISRMSDEKRPRPTGFEWLLEMIDPDEEDGATAFKDVAEYIIGRVNDSMGYDDATREAILTRLFARKGIELKFIDSTPDDDEPNRFTFANEAEPATPKSHNYDDDCACDDCNEVRADDKRSAEDTPSLEDVDEPEPVDDEEANDHDHSLDS